MSLSCLVLLSCLSFLDSMNDHVSFTMSLSLKLCGHNMNLFVRHNVGLQSKFDAMPVQKKGPGLVLGRSTPTYLLTAGVWTCGAWHGTDTICKICVNVPLFDMISLMWSDMIWFDMIRLIMWTHDICLTMANLMIRFYSWNICSLYICNSTFDLIWYLFYSIQLVRKACIVIIFINISAYLKC